MDVKHTGQGRIMTHTGTVIVCFPGHNKVSLALAVSMMAVARIHMLWG